MCKNDIQKAAKTITDTIYQKNRLIGKNNQDVNMAIYRLERKCISRVRGQNFVAAVAYRAGLKLIDTNLLNPKATTYDYSKKTDVAHTEIMLPDELVAQMNNAGLTLKA